MTTPDQELEDAIKAAGADKAPRVTPDAVEAAIAEEHYFTAKHGVIGESFMAGKAPPDRTEDNPLSLLTFCVLVLRNGFTVTGESACASPENFNAEVGRRVARRNAVDKIWPLLGFALKEELARGKA